MTALPSSCDLAAAHACGPGETTRHPRLVLAATVLASSLAFVDGSVVNVGLPAIGKSFAADPAALQWVINAYLLPLSALLLLGGAAGDRYGRRRLLVAGVTLFALASLACAWAPSLVLLLAGRAAQGAAAAMVLPNSLAILGGAFTDEAKGRAIGTWAAAGAVAGAVGPVLGGWLIDTVDWRAIFLLNLPLAAGAVLLALRAVPPDKPDADQPLDWRGGVLATLSLGLITWALTLGAGEAGWTVVTLGGVAAGVALFVAFLGVEHRRGERAMMPLAMFASRDFIGLTLLTLTLYGALGGMMVLVPYLLIETAGYSGTAAGARPAAVSADPGGAVAARRRPRRPRGLPDAARPGAAGGGGGLPAGAADRARRRLLDRGPALHRGDRARHERGGRAADHRRPDLRRAQPHGLGVRLQQRGGPGRRAGGHGPAGRGSGRPGRGAARAVPPRHGGRRRRLRGGLGQRAAADLGRGGSGSGATPVSHDVRPKRGWVRARATVIAAVAAPAITVALLSFASIVTNLAWTLQQLSDGSRPVGGLAAWFWNSLGQLLFAPLFAIPFGFAGALAFLAVGFALARSRGAGRKGYVVAGALAGAAHAAIGLSFRGLDLLPLETMPPLEAALVGLAWIGGFQITAGAQPAYALMTPPAATLAGAVAGWLFARMTLPRPTR
ncbi:MFS transporter [Phenylobacterium sp. J367]|nr:MFS transporter [Phenylobacterium sp. J367]MCR5877313.1 MFS transporter [Phenylobacterium sp. J367]